MTTQKPFPKIALACFLATVISAMMIYRIGLRYFGHLVPPRVFAPLTGIYFLIVLGYLFIRIRKQTRSQTNSTQILAFWQSAIRYFIALDMFVFGLCKFFHIQFNTPMALLDNPFNTFANDDLMWAFYGRSHVFTLLIGCMEMVGALLFLSKKTRLVAIFFLLPICLNIFLLDIFYNGVGTATYIGIEIIGLIYLLLIEYKRLVQFFFIDKGNAPAFTFKNASLKTAAKLSVIIIPVLLMVIVKLPQYYPQINGKYVVKNLIINNKPQSLPVEDSVLTKFYIDKNDIVLEYNGYTRRFIGSYTFDPATNQLTGIWRYPRNFHDTLFAHISPGNRSGVKMLVGRMGKDSLKVAIQKVNLN